MMPVTLIATLLAPIAAAWQPPGDLLHHRGLVRKGSYFVVPSEVELGRGLADIRTTEARLIQRLGEQTALDVLRARRRQEILDSLVERQRLNERLARTGSVFHSNRVIAQINALTDRIAFLQEQPVAGQEHVEAAVGQARREYIQAVTALRALADQTSEQYNRLRDEPEITAALLGVNRDARRVMKLGPRPNYPRNLVRLQELESRILSQAIPLRQQNNILWIDVLMNGIATPMILDTGASLITLPQALATRVGAEVLNPDGVIRLQIADGRLIDAQRGRIAEVRVGPFNVQDVACVVLPPEMVDAPPLLGATFLRNFVYEIDPQAGRLVLTRIED